MDTRQTYNLIAEDWAREQVDTDWWKAGLQHFASLFTPGARILDIGCGHGDKTEELRKQGLNVLGIDAAEKLIELGRKKFPELELRVLDMKNITELPETFDGIMAQASLLHLPRKEVPGIVGMLAEKLNPNGYLYISVKEVKPGRELEEIKKEDNYGYPYERFFSYFTLDEIKEYMEAVGLSITYETIKTSGRSNWIQVIGQKKKATA